MPYQEAKIIRFNQLENFIKEAYRSFLRDIAHQARGCHPNGGLQQVGHGDHVGVH
jgi:hypothetical protein